MLRMEIQLTFISIHDCLIKILFTLNIIVIIIFFNYTKHFISL